MRLASSCGESLPSPSVFCSSPFFQVSPPLTQTGPCSASSSSSTPSSRCARAATTPPRLSSRRRSRARRRRGNRPKCSPRMCRVPAALSMAPPFLMRWHAGSVWSCFHSSISKFCLPSLLPFLPHVPESGVLTPSHTRKICQRSEQIQYKYKHVLMPQYGDLISAPTALLAHPAHSLARLPAASRPAPSRESAGTPARPRRGPTRRRRPAAAPRSPAGTCGW